MERCDPVLIFSRVDRLAIFPARDQIEVAEHRCLVNFFDFILKKYLNNSDLFSIDTFVVDQVE